MKIECTESTLSCTDITSKINSQDNNSSEKLATALNNAGNSPITSFKYKQHDDKARLTAIAATLAAGTATLGMTVLETWLIASPEARLASLIACTTVGSATGMFIGGKTGLYLSKNISGVPELVGVGIGGLCAGAWGGVSGAILSQVVNNR
ncbi:hypothetical protein [Sodalis ligni]|uniref:Uncharacterized protein n=1 Tax=Sodalis ligni TaxID=2697027 RepID=A0A4R1NCH9_9GAMM|nr:hypothetical protein [Sodalis ligni]TCL05102.1 hypothetical protein EZJ58_3263 [Sodalis ligni]